MAKKECTSAAADERIRELEQGLYRGSILNWDCWQSRDVKQLAGNVRAISELALLAFSGLRAIVEKGSTLSVDDMEMTLLDDLTNMSALGSFVLARELGAVEVT